MTTPGTPRVRGFPAFPASRRPTRGRTWWARAWVDALDATSLSADPLKRGRRLATAGLVGPITVSPGRVAAPVHGGADSDRDAPYTTVVTLDVLTGVQWDRFCGQIAAHAGRLAALLDHELPRDLPDAAADADAPLLPGIADLEPECDCDGWEHPCEHAAALCYQAAWLLDDDPFLLLLMRGRGEAELLAHLQARNAELAGAAAAPVEPDAPDAPADARPTGGADLADPAGLPADPPDDPPTGPVSPVFVPEPAPGIDPDALVRLATDAAARARTLLTSDGRHDVPAGRWADTVRLAAEHPGDPRLRANLEHGTDPARLDRAVAAWRTAGADGLAALETPWTPRAAAPGWRTGQARAADALARARAEGTWDARGAPEVRRNRWTPPPPRPGAPVELRYGRDGRWHPYRGRDGAWWPAGPPRADAADALAALAASAADAP